MKKRKNNRFLKNYFLAVYLVTAKHLGNFCFKIASRIFYNKYVHNCENFRATQNLFTHKKRFSVPEEVHDESAALIQFNTEFIMRYCQDETGPDFSTMTFDKVVQEAFCGPIPNRKPLGIKNIFFFKC